jgi:hypothetical protein
MTFVLPSDADAATGSPTPAPSPPPDFLSQLSNAMAKDAGTPVVTTPNTGDFLSDLQAARNADARAGHPRRELTDQEFLGVGQPNGTRGATPDLSHVSDTDLQTIAAQGSSGATGGWSTAPMVHRWSNAPP